MRLTAPGQSAEHDGLVRRRLQPPPQPQLMSGRAPSSSGASIVVSVVSLAAVAWWMSKQDTPKFPDSLGG